jgi:hypothetical protein
MEPHGCNRRQPVANSSTAKSAEIKPKPLPWVATGCRLERMVRRVSGSSPEKGLLKRPANERVVLPVSAKSRRFAGTRRVHFGTSGHSGHARGLAAPPVRARGRRRRACTCARSPNLESRRAGPRFCVISLAARETERSYVVDGRARRSADRGPRGQGTRRAQVHHVVDPRVHDDGLRREPAQRADDGCLRPDVRLPLLGAGNRLPAASVNGRGRAGVRLVGRDLPLGERGHLGEMGPAGGVVPVRDDDLLLPHVAGVRREHVGLRLQPGPGDERPLHRHRDRHRLLGGRVPLGPRGHRRDRQAGL